MFFWPNIRLFPKKHPQFAKRLKFIGEKGTFLFAQTCTEHGVQPEVGVFFGPELTDFGIGPQILSTARCPRREGPFCILGSIFRLFVSELWPFSKKKKMADAPKSLPQSHCGGTVCQ